MNFGLPVPSKHKYLFLVFAVTSLISHAFAQQETYDLTGNTSQYSTAVIHEKMYVHTDKNVYVGGEMIWFSLYVTEASTHRLLDISKVAYVEMIDINSKAVLQAKITLKKGTGKGSFFIPPSLHTGSYLFRAYTSWMKNFPATPFFEKKLTVYNVQSKPAIQPEKDSVAYTLQFFPEGGHLVEGLLGKVACKSTNQQGKPVSYTGTLFDGTAPLLSFRSGFDGMSSFLFTPQAGHHYTSSIQTEDGKNVTDQLPAIDKEGYTLKVSDTNNNKVTFAIGKSHSPEDVYLLAHTNQAVMAAKKIRLQDSTTIVVFEKALLPDGISTFTLFDAQKQPVCERLFFKKPEHLLQLSLIGVSSEYHLRSKVSIEISAGIAGFQNNDPVQASMSVYGLDSLQGIDETTIDNYLLFTSELTGIIEHPSFYFSNDTQEALESLNNLLLINGWRKFTANQNAANKKPLFTYAPEYNGHIITGTVFNTQTGLPAFGVNTYLSVPGLQTQFYPSVSDSLGNIRFETSSYANSPTIIVQTNNQKDSIYNIKINNPFSDKPAPALTYAFSSLPQNTLLQHRIHMQVQNIYNSGAKAHFFSSGEDTAAFYLQADASYILDNYTRFTTLEEVLREYVSLVNVTKHEGNFHLPVFDVTSGQIMNGDPLVLIDGIPVFNLNHFLSYDPLKMRKLEVVQRRYAFGNNIFDGILNWQTYDGNFADFDLDSHAIKLDYEGLQEQRLFNSPVYQTETQQKSHQPDFRDMLYWSNDIKLTPGANQKVQFYTSDIAGKFVAVIQGISEKGWCGKKIVFFTVKK